MNRVIVKAPAVVSDILQQYDTRPEFDVVVDGNLGIGRLVLYDEEYAFNNEWPSAVHADELPADADDDEGWDLVDELHEANGAQVLNELLLKLAPYLAGTLTLQAATFASDGEFGEAKEWTVRPNATAVDCRKIVGFANDADARADLAATTVFVNGVP
jgi:hypothetical protein